MEPGVPFGLLAVAELLSLVAGLMLAAAAAGGQLRARAVPATGGALLLAAADLFDVTRLGAPSSDLDGWLRTAGFVLLAVGFALALAGPGSAARTNGLTVAPLGAALGPAAAGALAGLAAAGLALSWRHPAARWLAAGLAVQAAAAGMAVGAQHNGTVVVALLAVRGAGALLLLAGLAVLARGSLLTRVVQAILAGTTVTAIAAAAVVGTAVATEISRQQTRQVAQAAVGELATLTADTQQAQQFASLVAQCPPAEEHTCARGEVTFPLGDQFVATVAPHPARVVDSAGKVGLDEAALLDLAQQPAVTEALATPGYVDDTFVLLRGARTRLVALGVASYRDPAAPTAPRYAVAYGTVIDPSVLVAQRARSTFDSTVLTLPDGTVVASSLPASAAGAVAAQAAASGALSRLQAQAGDGQPGPAAITVQGVGSQPTTAYLLLDSGPIPVAVLAVSVPTAAILSSQRTVLELLSAALVVIGIVVAGLAVLVGRRVVHPIRRLTAAATAVTSGDLSARADVSGADEVGELSRAFDTMTTSLTATAAELGRTAEQERATRGRLQTVLNAIDDGLLVTDESGRVTGTNPAADRLLPAATGRELSAVLLDPAGAPLPVPGEGMLPVVGGGVIPVEIRSSVLPEGTGSVVLVRDMTAVRQTERMKTQFLANVSHELRTPLTPIVAYADMLRRSGGLAGPAAGFADQIAGAGKRMARVVDLLVEVAAIDAGRASATAAPVEAATFVAARVEEWRRRDPARGRDLRRRVSRGLPAMLVDAGWLARAVDELIDNALKFSPAGSPVLLSAATAPDGTGVRIAVTDTGPGIDPQAQAALFVDFEQADGSATRHREGLGLGLPFAARAAQVAGFRLVVSSASGQGSVFAVDVPVVPAPAPRPGSWAQSARVARNAAARPGAS